MITVFTPAYNRGHLLPRVYESLCRQTFKDFEWVIVDDGSSDDTRSVVEKFSVLGFELSDENETRSYENENSKLYTLNSKLKTNSIRYFYQENGGKHRAINRGVQEARGELFFIVDSDDMLPPDALEIVAQVYKDIKDDASFAGVCGLDGTFDGKVIGSGLPQEVIDSDAITVRNRMGVTGDMKEVFRTEVLKEFPFPEIVGERFCPEVLVWNRIAMKYKLRYFNRVIYLVEYQDDGISAGIVRARMTSPIASMMTYAELNSYDLPFVSKLKAAINYWRFRFCANHLNDNVNYPKMKWWWNLVMPIGFLFHEKDIRRER